MSHADTEALQHHLDEIARHLVVKAHTVVVLDQVGWHTTGKLPYAAEPLLIAAAAQIARDKPDREHLEVPATGKALQPPLRALRNNRGYCM